MLRLAPGGTHEFDAVSDDGRIVVSIKANSGLTSGGNHPTGKVATCLNEVYFLTLVDADVRLLALTNPAFHTIFTRITAGQIAPGIGVELLPLPQTCSEWSTVLRRSRAGRSARYRNGGVCGRS